METPESENKINRFADLHALKQRIDTWMQASNESKFEEIQEGLHFFYTHESIPDFKEWAGYKLGQLHMKQGSSLQNVDQAIEYFKVGSNQGHAPSTLMLASIYYSSQYGKKDLNKALELYIQLNNHHQSKGDYESIIEILEKEIHQ